MMKWIHKYAHLLSLLAVLAALAAAPYLIPENPDSPVFRSGTLGTLLVFACFFPVKDALTKADRRTLAVSMALGLLFASALSLGSELFIYDGLLPGMGSMLRRIAVPFMAAPLMGGVCARLMLTPPFSSKQPVRIPFAAYMLVLLICWLPVLLAYWPGMLNYDFVGEYAQHTSGSYSSIHPLLHSVLMNGVIALGSLLHSPTLGLLLMTLLQMALFAASLAHACVFAQRRGAPVWMLALLTALFGLHPVFSVMALSMTTDTLFAAAVLTLSLETAGIIEEPAAYFADKRRIALYVLLTVAAALMRNNGVFALALMLPAAVIAARGYRKRAAALAAAAVCASLAVLGGLHIALTPASLHSPFISRQTLLRSSGAPLRVVKRAPAVSFFAFAYRNSFFCRAETIMILRVLPLQFTVITPRRTASRVTNCSSLIRIPVPHIVCRTSERRSLFFLSAAATRRLYSSFVSSSSAEQKAFF